MTSEKASTPAPRPSFAWPTLVFVLLAVGLIVLFPPFRIVALNPGGAPVGPAGSGASVAFDAQSFCAKFWTEQLQPATTRVPDLIPILVELRRDPGTAAKHFARQVGLGHTAYYFTRASGHIVAIEKSRLVVAIDGADGATVAVRTGPVFGNTVRDGCGLLEVNAVPGLQEFNAIAAELNRLIEERVQPVLKSGVAVGTKIIFTGCAEAPESVGDGPLLTFIPVQAELKP